MQHDPIEISAITLIDKIIEFVAMLPDKNNWDINQLKLSSSYEIRYRQITTLLNYFIPEVKETQDLKIRIYAVLNGDFIESRPFIIYNELLNEMDKVILSSEIKIPKQLEWFALDLKSNYINTVKFKQKLYSILTFNYGYMEMYYQYLYNIEITNQIIYNIDTHTIDNFLGKVIDPLGRTVSKKTLVENYNYPEEDIYLVDLDNW